jgi:hypothetical protein
MITTPSNLRRERAIRNATVEGTGVLAARVMRTPVLRDFYMFKEPL